jgi:hypothetical protein
LPFFTRSGSRPSQPINPLTDAMDLTVALITASRGVALALARTGAPDRRGMET